MPDFKLKKIFGKGQSSSQSPTQNPTRQQVDGAREDSGSRRRREKSYSPHTVVSPEQHGPCVSSSGYGSRSSLSGSSFSGGGSKSNSLERQSHASTGSDGGISSMSGSGTDDSGHSSMSSPLNLPMEQLQSFNAMYRAGQPQSMPSPYHQLNVQGPPKNVKQQTHQTSTYLNQNQYSLSKTTKSLSVAAGPELFFEGKEHYISISTDDVFRPECSADRSKQRKQPSHGYQRDTSHYVNLSYPLLERSDFNRETDDSGIVPEPPSEDHGDEIECHSLHLYGADTTQEDYRNKIIFELQWQVSELHERCAQLQKEADLARDRLGSSMHSVTTFWSPELKKERVLRKEEATRCNRLYEQLVVRQAELKQQQELCKQKEEEGSSDSSRQPARDAESCVGEEDKRAQEEWSVLQQRAEELKNLLEMQQQTLSARDASIKTLRDMLQGKRKEDDGRGESERSEQETLHAQAAINANRICELEATLQAKDIHLRKLKEVFAQLYHTDGQMHPI